MKLTLCVPLIWMLFSSAEALKCVQENHHTAPQPCNSDVQCLTFAFQEFSHTHLSKNITSRTCVPSSFCIGSNQSFSLGFDYLRMTSFLECCSTDGCNNKNISYLDEQKPNGLQCYTRFPWAESDLVKHQCLGIEDRCIFANISGSSGTYPLYGCASANLCEGHTELKFSALFYRSFQGDLSRFSAPKCCETSLCNSAPADKLSVISLLVALVALSVH